MHSKMVEEQLLVEIKEGHNRILPSPAPYCCHVSAIPEATDGVRLIRNLSSPSGRCPNGSTAEEDDLHCQSEQDAVHHLRPGHYTAKADRNLAYRSVRTHPTSWSMTKPSLDPQC